MQITKGQLEIAGTTTVWHKTKGWLTIEWYAYIDEKDLEGMVVKAYRNASGQSVSGPMRISAHLVGPIATQSTASETNATYRRVYSRMDEATAAASLSAYIFAFESRATGTVMYAVTNDPSTMNGSNKVVQMRGPQKEFI